VNRGARFWRIPFMNRRGSSARGLILAGTSAGGLVGGHLLSYLLLAPDGGHRQALLHQTGHGYLPRALVMALVLSALAAVIAARMGFRRRRIAVHAVPGVPATALRLSILQASGFVALEVIERLVSGSGLGDLTGPLLAVGVASQVAVACVGAALLALIGRAAESVARALGMGPVMSPQSVTSALLPSQPQRRRSVARQGAPTRGPPSLLLQHA
jgi:hypothetical protein